MATATFNKLIKVVIDFKRLEESTLENDFLLFIATNKLNSSIVGPSPSRSHDGRYEQLHTQSESWKIEQWLKEHGVRIYDET